ncbi:MAG: SDR family oxidoreductase [Rhodanobacter sp.]
MSNSSKQGSKIVLITGGSRGLGRSAALQLAERGHDLIITWQNNEEAAKHVVAQIEKTGRRALALKLDVGNSASFPAFAESLRKNLEQHWQRKTLDALVNNAGGSLHASFAETTEAQFDEVMRVHLKGTFFLTQALLPLIADGGQILNVSSGLPRFSFAGSSAYGAMKGAVEVLTRYLAQELGERRIRANVLAPGAIATDFSGGMVRDNPEVNAQIASATALGRVGEADDIGRAVAMLLSDDSGWINGQRIEASGGMRL